MGVRASVARGVALTSASREFVDFGVFVDLLQNHRPRLKQLALAKFEVFIARSVVKPSRWREHLECIQDAPQSDGHQVHTYIRRVDQLRAYIGMDIYNALIFLIGLLPPHWQGYYDRVIAPGTTRPIILHAEASLTSTLWSVAAFYLFIIFHPNLRTDTVYEDLGARAEFLNQLQHLLTLNEDEPFLPNYVAPLGADA